MRIENTVRRALDVVPQWCRQARARNGASQAFYHQILCATAVAVAASGPLAIAALFAGQSIPLLALSVVAGLVAVAAVLGQRHDIQAGTLAIFGGLGLGAAALAPYLPGPFNAASALAIVSVFGAFKFSRRWPEALAGLPGVAALGLGLFSAAGPISGTALGFAVLAMLAAAAIAWALIRAGREITTAHTQAQTMAETVENLVGAVVRYDMSGQPAYISDAASAMLGARAFELAGQGLFERVHILDRPAYAKALSDERTAAKGSEIEVRLRRDDPAGQGSDYLWVEIAFGSIPDVSGGRIVVAVFKDISARKQNQYDLEHARAQAIEASEAKSRFLATIGHELRTPLNAIVGFSDMMAEGIGGELSTTHAEYAGHISQSGHHLLEVVNMLLDMSKIDAGKFEVQAEAFDPLGLVEPCLQMVEKLGRDHNVHLATAIDPRLPNIMGDERACRQIVINLLSNAIKFSHSGGEVLLSMKRQGKMLAIAVSDFGIGMDAETVERIGEPFLQAQSSLSRRYEGTGLGLSIVKGLVGLHDGKLSVASEPGSGTRVTVLLPLDGPAGRTTGTIEHLQPRNRESDENKWLNDEKRSATR